MRISIWVDGGVGGSIRLVATDMVDVETTKDQGDGNYSATGFGNTSDYNGAYMFRAYPDSGYKFVRFNYYQETIGGTYVTQNPWYPSSSYWGGCTNFYVEAVFEEDTSSGGGGSSGGGDDYWDWGTKRGTLTDSDYDTDSLSAFSIDYVKFTAPSDGHVTFTVYDSNDDLVLYAYEGSADIIDKYAPEVEYDYRADKTTKGTESLDFSVNSGERWEFGWYEYDGESATVDWELIFEPDEPELEGWMWDDNPRDDTYTGTSVAYVNPGAGQIDYFYFIPPENGTLVIQSATTDSDTDPYGWIALKGALSPSTTNGNGNDALVGDYIARADSGVGDSYSNFKITAELKKGVEYQIYSHDYFQDVNPSGYDINLTWTPAPPAQWKAPTRIANITANTSTSTTAYYDKANYIQFTTPAYKGKLVVQTTQGTSGSQNYYSYLSTGLLNAATGTLRNASVNTSGAGYITEDDDGGGNYDTLISLEGCSANSTYYWYVNTSFKESGTYTLPWKLAYYQQRTITYNANGGSGAPGAQIFYDDKLKVTLSTATPSRSGYQFLGWSTSSSATTATYIPGQVATLSAQNYTLYAVWKTLTTYVTITYNANGGSGAPASQQVVSGSTITINTSTTPTKTAHIFKGWHTSSSATSPLYKKGSTINIPIKNNITLYAIWWPDFNWNLRDHEEASLLDDYVSMYIGDTGNPDVLKGDLYNTTWFNAVAAKVNAEPVNAGELIDDIQLDNLLVKYRNY